MNRREKILAASIGGLLVLGLVIFGLRGVISGPLKELDKRIAAAREKIEKIRGDRRAYFTAEDHLKEVGMRTFAETVDEAGARSGEMLTKQILAAGLHETDFTRLPVGPRKLRGANEIGWNVQGDGPLTNIVNLLYLLDHSPWIHRTENFRITTGDAPGTVHANFRYLTLVLDPAPEVQRTNLVSAVSLEDPTRYLLNSIVSRDLFRPYIRRPPAPTLPGQPHAPPSRPGMPPGPENFRVVSLSDWGGSPEVSILDLTAQKSMRYRPGDELLGGVIALVDERTRPRPGNSFLQSHSRLILKIDGEYWAVENGRTLAEKRKLTPSEIPPQLARRP